MVQRNPIYFIWIYFFNTRNTELKTYIKLINIPNINAVIIILLAAT